MQKWQLFLKSLFAWIMNQPLKGAWLTIHKLKAGLLQVFRLWCIFTDNGRTQHGRSAEPKVRTKILSLSYCGQKFKKTKLQSGMDPGSGLDLKCFCYSSVVHWILRCVMHWLKETSSQAVSERTARLLSSVQSSSMIQLSLPHSDLVAPQPAGVLDAEGFI